MKYKFVDAEQLDADLASIANAIRTKTNSTKQLAFPSEMEQSILNISTGVELNFEIVGNPQPQNPPANTIWVDTDVDITGYYIQNKQPSNMKPGEIWISAGTQSQGAFNALKKGVIMVYPLSVKQMVNSTLEDKTAKSYQNGKWVDWIMRIYELGWADSENDLIQLASDYSGNTSTVDKCNIDVSYSSGYIVMTRISYNGMACVYTKLEYDLTDVNTIYCKTGSIGDGYGSDNGAIYFGVGKVGSTVSSAKIKLTESNTKYALDVSALSGKFVIGFYGPENSSANWIWNARQIEAFWY